MATREVVVNICNICAKEALEEEGTVTSHVIVVDGEVGELHACEDCWPTDILGKLLAASDKPKKRRRA